MTVIGQERAIHLVSKNKCICVWHWRLAHISNKQVVRAFKLVDGINLRIHKYDLSKVLIDLDDFDSNSKTAEADVKPTLVIEYSTLLIIANHINKIYGNIDKLCDPCVGSKSNWVVRNMTMTPVLSKFEEVYTDLWGFHNLSCQFWSVYARILICKYIQKTWTFYLYSKNDFVDTFQDWLPRVEVESECCMKTLIADEGREFILAKLWLFCKKRGIAIKYAVLYIHKENNLVEWGWRTLVTIKDSLLIDTRLPNGFWAKAIKTANYLYNRLPN